LKSQLKQVRKELEEIQKQKQRADESLEEYRVRFCFVVLWFTGSDRYKLSILLTYHQNHIVDVLLNLFEPQYRARPTGHPDLHLCFQRRCVTQVL